MEDQEWTNKAEGFCELFEKDQKPRTFAVDELEVQVHLCLFTRDRNPAAEGTFKRSWKDDIPTALESLSKIPPRSS